MSGRFPGTMSDAMRQTGDTRNALWVAWRFLMLDLFQVVSMLFFAVYAFLWAIDASGVKVSPWTAGWFAAAATSYGLLLVCPALPWVRVAAVLFPVLGAGSRAITLLGTEPPQPGGFVVWCLLAFVYSYAGPRLMPPPLRNGERRRWLREGGTGRG